MAKITLGGLRKIIREELENAMGKQTQLKKWCDLNNQHGDFEYHHKDEIKNNPDMLNDEEFEGLGDYADEIVIDGRMRGGGTYGYHDERQDVVYLLHPGRGYVKMIDPDVHNWPSLDDEDAENDPRWPAESEETKWDF